MSANVAVAIVALGGACTVMLSVMGAAALWRARGGRVAARVAALRARTPYVADGDVLREGSGQGRRAGTSWDERMQLRLHRAGLPLRPGEFLALRGLAAVVGGLVGLLAGRAVGFGGAYPLLFSVVSAALGSLVPVMYLARRTRRRHQDIEAQLVEMCELMASMMRSGFGYMQALTATVSQLGAPISQELQPVLDSVRLGGDVDTAFESLEQRLDSPDFRILATAIAAQRRSGGNLSEILTGVAETIRDRHALRLEVAALTSRERYSALVVAGFPVVVVGVLTYAMPEVFGRLFTDFPGRVMLVVGLCMDLIGYLVIKRVTEMDT